MGILLATAYKMAIEALERQRSEHYAFDRNLHEVGIVSIRTRNAKTKYGKFTEAIDMMRAEKNRLTTREK